MCASQNVNIGGLIWLGDINSRCINRHGFDQFRKELLVFLMASHRRWGVWFHRKQDCLFKKRVQDNSQLPSCLSALLVLSAPEDSPYKGRISVVCFITKSFLTYSFFPPTPALSTISRSLSSSMCSITPETANVCSSYNRMRGPGIGCWSSDRSNCSHWSFEAAVLPINPNIYTDQCTTRLLLLLLVLIQLCSPRCWHLDSNYCRTRCRQSQLRFVLSPLLLRSSRIFHFSHWLGQLSTVVTKDESPHTGYTFTPWVVSFTPPSIEHKVGGTSILRLTRTTMESHENDSRNPDRTAWQV